MHSEQSECELYRCPSYRKPNSTQHKYHRWPPLLGGQNLDESSAGGESLAATSGRPAQEKVQCNVGCGLLKHLRAYGKDEIQQKTLRFLRCTSCPWPCLNCSPRTPPPC